MTNMSTKIVMGFLFALVAHGAFAQPVPSRGSEAETGENCLAIGEMGAMEKCFATSVDFKDCPETDGRCAPYKKMHVLEQRLEQLSEKNSFRLEVEIHLLWRERPGIPPRLDQVLHGIQSGLAKSKGCGLSF
jgi:hypothetical protein